MIHKVAFPDVMDARVQDKIRSQLPEDFSIAFAKTTDRSENLARVADAEFILTTILVDADMLSAAPRLKLRHKWGVGVDKFDLNAARQAGVPVAIRFGASVGAVAEHVLMLMLATYRRISLADRSLRNGIWLRPQLRAQCYQLCGKTVGLLGFGNVARMVAHRPAGFEVEIIYSDIRRADMATERSVHATRVSFEELISRSDVLSIHVPLTPITKGMIGAEAIAQMKTGAIIINAARGGIVDETALYDALVSGKLHGAGLDVFAMEPADPANPLFRLDQVVVTPHTAGRVIEPIGDIAPHAFTNMLSVLRGEPLPPDDTIVAPREK